MQVKLRGSVQLEGSLFIYFFSLQKFTYLFRQEEKLTSVRKMEESEGGAQVRLPLPSVPGGTLTSLEVRG